MSKKSASFAAHTVTAAFPSANVDVSILHSLGVVPGAAFVISADTRAAKIYKGLAGWTATTIVLRSNVARVGVTLLLVGGGTEEALAQTTRIVTGLLYSHSNISNDFTWVDAATHTIRVVFVVPPDYASGDVTFKLIRRAGSGTGTAVMNRSTFRYRDATAISTVESGVAMNFTPGDTNPHLTTWTIAASNFQAGDTFRVDIERLGGNASDTLASTVLHSGLWMEYLAVQ